MKQLGGLTYCLGVHVHLCRSRGTIAIYQSKYISDIVARFNLADAKPMATPIALGTKLSEATCPTTNAEKSEMNNIPYKAAIGCLIYLTVWTRLDIAKATQELAQYSQNPEKAHWQAAKCVYRYLTAPEALAWLIKGWEKEACISRAGLKTTGRPIQTHAKHSSLCVCSSWSSSVLEQ